MTSVAAQTRLYQVALTLLPGIGPTLAKHLVSYCGGVEAVFKAPARQLEKIPGIGGRIAKAIRKADIIAQAENEVAFMEKQGVRPIFYLEPEYPTRLKSCADCPVLLYYQGKEVLDALKIIGIVGTRQATEYGRDFCERLIAGLVPHRPLIVSGLAYGIDAYAHQMALKHELPTVGVLGHGLDRVYPYPHMGLARQMKANGGLLTEFPSGTNPDRENFPRRNRIVAGMCDALIVVQTAKKGGAMITARLANSYNREVMALPGPIDAERSAGCNHLIKTHQAALITGPEDVEYLLGWEAKKETEKNQQLQLELQGSEQHVADYLKNVKQAHIDDICLNTHLASGEAANTLLNMEFKGVVKSMPGKRYKLI